MANFSISYIYQIKDKMSPALKRITQLIKEQQAVLGHSEKTWRGIVAQDEKYNRSLNTTITKTKKFSSSLDDGLGTITAMTAGIVGVGMAMLQPLKAAAKYETAMIGVAKSASLDKGTAAFDNMSKSIRNMAMDTGFAAEGIASMFESGARLGIKNSNLAQFAHLSAMTATALDMTAESAGDAIARMKNAVGIPMQKMEGFLDVINNLDSTTAAKGADLIEILTRSGGALASAGVNPELSAGLAATAAQIMPTAELASSGLNMAINRIMKNPTLSKDFMKAPKESLFALVDSLKGMDKIARRATINKLFGDEAGRFMNNLVERSEVLKTTLGEAGKEVSGSMKAEFDKVQNSTEVMAQKVQVIFTDMMISLGDAFEPVTRGVLQFFITFGMGVSDFVTKHQDLVFGLEAIAGGIFAVNAALVITKTLVTAIKLLFFQNPIALAVGAIIGVMIILYNKVEFVRNALDALASAVMSFFEGLLDFLGFSYDKIKEFFVGGDAADKAKANVAATPTADKSESLVNVSVSSNDVKVDSVETTQMKGATKVSYTSQMSGA